MKMGASLSFAIFEFNCCHSWSAKVPFLSLSDSISASALIIRVTNWRELISKENIATPRNFSVFAIQAFLATLNAKAVLPIPGRAAIIINSDFWKPEVTLSNLEKPEGIPVKPPSLPRKLSISIIAS